MKINMILFLSDKAEGINAFADYSLMSWMH